MNSEISRGEDIAPAIEALKDRADAIYVQTDPIMNTHRVRISTLALGAGCRRCLAFGSMSRREF